MAAFDCRKSLGVALWLCVSRRVCRVRQCQFQMNVILLHEASATINCQGNRIIAAGVVVLRCLPPGPLWLRVIMDFGSGGTAGFGYWVLSSVNGRAVAI